MSSQSVGFIQISLSFSLEETLRLVHGTLSLNGINGGLDGTNIALHGI